MRGLLVMSIRREIGGSAYPWYEIDKRTKKLVPHDMTEELSPKGLQGDNAW